MIRVPVMSCVHFVDVVKVAGDNGVAIGNRNPVYPVSVSHCVTHRLAVSVHTEGNWSSWGTKAAVNSSMVTSEGPIPGKP